MHLDLRADGVSTAEELERLQDLGARRLDVGQTLQCGAGSCLPSPKAMSSACWRDLLETLSNRTNLTADCRGVSTPRGTRVHAIPHVGANSAGSTPKSAKGQGLSVVLTKDRTDPAEPQLYDGKVEDGKGL